VVSGGIYGGYRAWDKLQHSEDCMLHDLRITGNRAMMVEEIAAACGLEVGRTNVFFARESEISNACLNDVRIREVEVLIEPPSRIEVRVDEHEPVLYVQTDHGMWWANEAGELIAPTEPEDWRALPLLKGASAEMIPWQEQEFEGRMRTRADAMAREQANRKARETAEARRSALLRDALALARTVDTMGSPWFGGPINLEYNPVLGFSVSGRSGSLKARFGKPPFEMKLTRLNEALQEALERRMVISEAFLDNTARPNEITLLRDTAGELAAAGAIQGDESEMEARP
jgi:hypothetical protein